PINANLLEKKIHTKTRFKTIIKQNIYSSSLISSTCGGWLTSLFSSICSDFSFFCSSIKGSSICCCGTLSTKDSSICFCISSAMGSLLSCGMPSFTKSPLFWASRLSSLTSSCITSSVSLTSSCTVSSVSITSFCTASSVSITSSCAASTFSNSSSCTASTVSITS
ncbi:unnamed protein product, partial [Meganyctiphanes norvegica]